MVPADKLIKRLAEYLKKNNIVTPPQWALYVKTGVSKRRPPQDPDWWYVRCASILRKLYIHGPMSVKDLRREYGGRRRVRTKPPHSWPGSGAIVRKALQQLEAAGLVQKVPLKGRILTPEGTSLLDRIAKEIMKEEGTPEWLP